MVRRARAALVGVTASLWALLAHVACTRSGHVVEAPVLSASAAALAMAPYVKEAGVDEPTDKPGSLHEGDRFTGEYTCPQGLTSMTLAIEATGSGPTGVRAVFEFKHEPTAVRGSYRMRGAFDPKTGKLKLVKNSWIRRPSGYSMTDLEGELLGSTMKGRILAPGCGGFELELED